MADLFKEIIPAILHTKKNVLENEKDYKAYHVNYALSLHHDCIMQANMMNIYNNLNPSIQNQYLINTIRGYKRPFQKWLRAETIENLDAVKEYYNYSNSKAKEALKLLSDADIDEIKRKIKKGGLSNDKSRGTD